MEISSSADDVFLTALAEVESMVNTRPLTYLPLDTAEDHALTLNHFLLLSFNGVCQPAVIPQDEKSAVELELCAGHVRQILEEVD